MATNLVTPLDDSLAYLNCPTCRDNGTANVPLSRDMHKCRCPFGHEFPSVGEVIARGGQMVPLPLHEQPPLTSVKWPVWIHPKVKEILETKYRGRLIATLDTIFGSLADGNVIIITGKDADAMKKRGLSTGAQMVAKLEAVDSNEAERDQMAKRLAKLEDLLRSVAGEE